MTWLDLWRWARADRGRMTRLAVLATAVLLTVGVVIAAAVLSLAGWPS